MAGESEIAGRRGPRLILIGCLLFMPVSARALNGLPPNIDAVPDKVTAVRIAEAVLDPIYGHDRIIAERPFSAALHGGIWNVAGYLPPGVDGGVAKIWIKRRDGRIIRIIHGK